MADINPGALYLTKDNISNLTKSVTNPTQSGPFYTVNGGGTPVSMSGLQSGINSGALTVDQDPSGTFTEPAPVVDPYAQWGGEDKYNALVSGFNAREGNIFDSTNRSIQRAGSDLGAGITDWLRNSGQQQQKINLQSRNNELNKMRGVSGILGMVGRGINSAGVMLGNRNAGDSSAVGAIARAYGQMGQREMSGIGNQYAQGQSQIGLAQSDLQASAAAQQADNDRYKENFITDIVNSTSDAIKQLNLEKAQLDIPGQIAVDQRIEEIRQQARTALSQFDQQWNSGVAGLQGEGRDTSLAEALKMQQAGTDLGAGAFDYTDQAPLQMQGSYPSGGNLPLYTMPRRRQ